MKKTQIKENLITLLIYFTISFIFFLPAFTHGYLIAFDDAFTQDFPLRMYYSSLIKEGFPLWVPYEFTGMPLLGIIHLGVFYPLNLIYFLLPVILAFNLNIVIHYALASLFMYLYLKEIKVKNFSAFAGGLLFSFTGFMIANKNYISMINTAIWLPILLLFYERIKTDIKLKDSIIAGLIFAICISAGHPQIVMYTGFILLIYTLFSVFQTDKKAKFLFYCLIPVLIGILINLPILSATKELADFSYRIDMTKNYDIYTHYSFYPALLSTFIYPYLLDLYTYIHSNGFKFFGYIGIMPLILAVITSVKLANKNRLVLFWTIIACICFFLIFGKHNPLYKLTYHIPIYNMFRYPTRNMFGLDVALVVLFSIGLNHILCFSDKYKQILKNCLKLLIFISFTTVPVILLLVFKGLLKINLLNLIIPVFFMASSFFLFLSLYKLQISKKTFKVIFSLLILLESFLFGAFVSMDWLTPEKMWVKAKNIHEYLNNSYLSFLKNKDKTNRSIMLNNDDYIIIKADLYKEPFPTLYIPSKVSFLNGYDAFAYNDLSKITGMSQNGVTNRHTEFIKNPSILSMLNIKYIVSVNPQTSEKYSNLIQQDKKSFKKVYDDATSKVYENINALPKVYFVEKINFEKNINEVSEKIKNKNFSPQKTAFLLEKDKNNIKNNVFSKGQAQVTSYKNDEITIKADLNKEGFLVLADKFYPGWKATINNKETSIYQTNGTVRGIIVPPGRHDIVFKYMPEKLKVQTVISLFTLLVCILLITKPCCKKRNLLNSN